jgi:ubiquinol-cytochrome c reductase cytochrome b subunit
VIVALLALALIRLYAPLILGDDENFTAANPAVTPRHIQPEWYFLFAYAILRAVPNKLGGVMALASAVLILYTLPFSFLGKKKSLSFYPLNKISYWCFTVIVLLLT